MHDVAEPLLIHPKGVMEVDRVRERRDLQLRPPERGRVGVDGGLDEAPVAHVRQQPLVHLVVVGHRLLGADPLPHVEEEEEEEVEARFRGARRAVRRSHERAQERWVGA